MFVSEARSSLFYASLLSISLTFTFLKLFLYTQSVILRFIPSPCFFLVRSPYFIPSLCSIPSPQSVDRSPQSRFYTDRVDRVTAAGAVKNITPKGPFIFYEVGGGWD